MSMQHKAYFLDYEAFKSQMGYLLESALMTGSNDKLVQFIEANITSLKDPYEGEPLDESWENLIEVKDAHSYGDFALTKFYHPTMDIGLGDDWEGFQDLLNDVSSELGAAFLGRPFGPEGNYFDPGKMGSYFHTAGEVQQNLSLLKDLARRRPEIFPILNPAIEMLKQAAEAGRGLYVTF
jgi:hypothetical protein